MKKNAMSGTLAVVVLAGGLFFALASNASACIKQGSLVSAKVSGSSYSSSHSSSQSSSSSYSSSHAYAYAHASATSKAVVNVDVDNSCRNGCNHEDKVEKKVIVKHETDKRIVYIQKILPATGSGLVGLILVALAALAVTIFGAKKLTAKKA